MKPDNKKWEELMDDPKLEGRIRNHSFSRYRREKNRNRILVGVIAMILMMINIFSINEYIYDRADLTTNVSFLVDELDSGLFFHIVSD